jgi:ribosomal protein S18 acetylase RimI-like enzyme
MPSSRPAGLIIRHRSLDDLPAIQALMARVYAPPLHGPEAVWSERSMLRHLARFPQGQFVADLEGAVVGTSTCMRLSLERALAPHTWGDLTARGTLATHEPEGEALYGVNIAVDPACQGQGVGHALYEARIALARSQGCRWFVAGARIPGYHRHAERMSPEDYLAEVAAGRLFDPTVSKQMAVGFQVRGLLRDYAPDPETLGHAALIVMEL